MKLNTLRPTYGLEEESFVIHRETRTLVTPIPECRRLVEQRLGIQAAWEYKASVLELVTPICHDPTQLIEEAAANRYEASSILREFDCDLLPLATHPLADARAAPAREGQRYRWIELHKGNAVKNLLVNGVHLHVGTYLNNAARLRAVPVLMHLVPIHAAATACSPYFEAEDTGQESWRLRVLMQLASLLPAAPRTSEGLARLGRAMRDAGGPRDGSEQWGLIRPGAGAKPTIEFRAADASPSLDPLVWLAALSGAAVHAERAGRVTAPPVEAWDAIIMYLVNLDNVAAHGADAKLIDPFDGCTKSVDAYVASWVARCANSIDELGLGNAISLIPTHIRHPAAALREVVEASRRTLEGHGVSPADASQFGLRAALPWALREAEETPRMSWITEHRTASEGGK